MSYYFTPKRKAKFMTSNLLCKQRYKGLEKLEAKGPELRYPDTGIIQDGLFELRVGRKDISRTFFAYAKGRKIYILRTFIKKTPKTPKAEIALATSRWEELKDGC